MFERKNRIRVAIALSIGVLFLVVLQRIRVRLSSGGISEYDWRKVAFFDGVDAELGTARVRVADTDAKRYVGLSRAESLGDAEGMLFVHPCEQSVSYVMREMSFPVDIVFVDGDRTVTEIYHAELPTSDADGSDLRRYEGRAKYVLELPYQFTSERGVEAGDRIRTSPDPGH